MVVSWLNPVLDGLKHRANITDFVRGMSDKLLGRRVRLAMTGMEGVGKNVLLDAMTGKLLKPGYKKPGRSRSMEQARLRNAGKRILWSVVPGQIAYPRYVALDKLFSGNDPVDGVIHVVSWGYAVVREEDARRILIRDQHIDTMTKFRNNQIKREIEDLQATCERIRAAHRKHRKPNWMIIAVDKIDLFIDQVATASAYYSPSSQSPIVDCMTTLTNQVGSDFFRWEAIPVCGCIEPFEWNRETTPARLDDDTRQRYLGQFLAELDSHCV
jgi:hypothetical protein